MEALGPEVLGGGKSHWGMEAVRNRGMGRWRHWGTEILGRQTEALGDGGTETWRHDEMKARDDGGTAVPRYWEMDGGIGVRRQWETGMGRWRHWGTEVLGDRQRHWET